MMLELEHIYIDTDEHNVYIECPQCGNTEQQPIDQQRSHLQSFTLIDWKSDLGSHQRSEMKCCNCETSFYIIWRYKSVFECLMDDLRMLRDSEHHVCPACDTDENLDCTCVKYDTIIQRLEQRELEHGRLIKEAQKAKDLIGSLKELINK